MRNSAYFLTSVKIVLANGGYRGEIVEQIKMKLGYLNQCGNQDR